MHNFCLYGSLLGEKKITNDAPQISISKFKKCRHPTCCSTLNSCSAIDILPKSDIQSNIISSAKVVTHASYSSLVMANVYSKECSSCCHKNQFRSHLYVRYATLS